MSRQERERRGVTDASDRAKNHTGGFTSNSINLPKGAQLFEPKAGTMYLDIIPYEVKKGKDLPDGNPYAEKGDLHYERTFFVHKGIGAEGGTYVCPKKTAGERCPICEYRAKLAKQEGADEEVVKEMGAKERQLFNVFDRKNPEASIQLWDVSFHLFGKLLDERINSEQATKEWKRFHSPSNGMTLVVTFREKKYGKATFYETTSIDFKERGRQHEDSIVDEAFNLDDVLKVLSYDKLRAILLEAEDAESPDADEEKPSRKAAADDDEDATPPKRKSAPADEEEEEAPPAKKKAAAADDDDDDWDAKPAKKKAAADEEEEEKPDRKKADADWDEEEAPKSKKKPAADEEEEEAPPAKKKKVEEEEEPEEKPAKKKAAADDDWD